VFLALTFVCCVGALAKDCSPDGKQRAYTTVKAFLTQKTAAGVLCRPELTAFYTFANHTWTKDGKSFVDGHLSGRVLKNTIFIANNQVC
jgi:hypothetical protein